MNQYDEAIQFCNDMIRIFMEIKPDEVEFAKSIKTKLETIQNESNNNSKEEPTMTNEDKKLTATYNFCMNFLKYHKSYVEHKRKYEDNPTNNLKYLRDGYKNMEIKEMEKIKKFLNDEIDFEDFIGPLF